MLGGVCSVWYVVCLELQTEEGFWFHYIRLAVFVGFGGVKTSYLLYIMFSLELGLHRAYPWTWHFLFNIVIDTSPTKQSIN